MPRWTIDSATSLDFDGIVALHVRVVAGSVAVLATGDHPRLEVTEVSGQPLLVTHDAGILTITYADLSWDGLLGWLRPHRHSANLTITVQHDCPVQLGVVSATALLSGMSARTSLKSVSGDMTLDGVTGTVEANTVSGRLEAQALDGSISFRTVSGDLTVAGGQVGRLEARTVSGRVTADLELAPGGDLRVSTISGEVTIRLPAATDARVDLRSPSGRVWADFDGLTLSGSPAPRTVTGSLGDGSGKLSVTSVSGDVTILRRPGEARDQAPGAQAAEGEEPATAMRAVGTTMEGEAP